MYAGCSYSNCNSRAEYIIDVTLDNQFQTHTRCRKHTKAFPDNYIVQTIKGVHDIVLELSKGGTGTDFLSSCSFCSGKEADEIIRFIDSLNVTCTSARCSECANKIAESRDVQTRHNIESVSVRAEDCEGLDIS